MRSTVGACAVLIAMASLDRLSATMPAVTGALRSGWASIGSRATFALAILTLVASPARAQDADALAPAQVPAVEAAEPVVASDAEVERAPGHAPDPSRVAAADELPDDADSGPPIIHRRRDLTPEQLRWERERSVDVSEPLMPGMFQLHIGLGGALDSSLDGALVSHGYAESPLVVLGDLGFLGRVTEWLHVGGRLGGRGRVWRSNDRSPASAGGIDAMVIAHARMYLGRIVDLGAVLGLGVGWAGVSLQGAPATGFAPRIHGGAVLGFRLAPGVRLDARFAWDWFTLDDLDRYGSDLDLGGPSASLGIEVRR